MTSVLCCVQHFQDHLLFGLLAIISDVSYYCVHIYLIRLYHISFCMRNFLMSTLHISSLLLVFHRKDLCEARVNFKESSYFPTKCTLRWADPQVLTSCGQEQNYIIFSNDLYPSDELTPQYWHLLAKTRIRSSLQMTCPQAELGHLFGWPAPSDGLPPARGI